MKSYLALLINLIIFSSFVVIVEPKRILRHRNAYRLKQNPPKGVQSNNIVYQFMMGALAEISGAYSMIDECSDKIPDWATTRADKEEPNDTIDTDTKPLLSKLEKILGYLGEALNYACTLKDKLISFFAKRRRRFIRLMIQRRTSRRRRFRWNVSGFIKSAKSAISSVGSGISAGALSLNNSVVDGVNWAKKKASEVADYVKDKIQGVIQPILDLLESIKTKFSSFLEQNQVLKIWYEFCQCFINLRSSKLIKGVYEKISTFIKTVSSLSTSNGWVEAAINLICGWKDLRDSISYLKVAYLENKKPTKYNYYGRFIGKLMSAIVG